MTDVSTKSTLYPTWSDREEEASKQKVTHQAVSSLCSPLCLFSHTHSSSFCWVTNLLKRLVYVVGASQSPVYLYRLLLQPHLIQRLGGRKRGGEREIKKDMEGEGRESHLCECVLVSVCILPSVYPFAWLAGRSAHTSQDVSLSWSSQTTEWPQNHWRRGEREKSGRGRRRRRRGRRHVNQIH